MSYEDKVLQAWEEVYKKGQLTLWIFLALRDSAKYVEEIQTWIKRQTNGIFDVEEQSLYRALRKFHDLEIVDFEEREGNRGPQRKYYRLTPLGQNVLDRFIHRNISLFSQPTLQKLLRVEAGR